MGRLRGFLWLFASLVVAGLAGIVAFVALSRARAQTVGEQAAKPTVPVVVAARVVALRSTLLGEDLEVRDWPVDAVPEGAISSVAEAEGKITLVDLYPGEVIVAQRLLDPNIISGDGRLAVFMAEDEVLMAFPAQDLMSRMDVLKPGDRVDILISLEFPIGRGLEVSGTPGRETGAGEEELSTFSVLQNVGVAAIIGGQADSGQSKAPLAAAGREVRAPQAILFTLKPQDALVLKYVKDAGGIQDIVLRAPGVEQPFSLEPVDVDYVVNRYRIPTGVGD